MNRRKFIKCAITGLLIPDKSIQAFPGRTFRDPSFVGQFPPKSSVSLPSSIRRWKLDEGSGTTSSDADGSGDALTLTSPTWVANGTGISTPAITSPYALSFQTNPGASSKAQNSTNGAGLADNAVTATINLWSYTSGSSDSWFCGFGTTFAQRFGTWMTGSTLYGVSENGSQNFPNVSFSLIGWHMITLVFNGALAATSRTSIYIDGSLQTLTPGGAGNPTTLATAANLSVFELGLFSGVYYKGGVDDVWLDNTAWTQSQITAVYNAGAQ